MRRHSKIVGQHIELTVLCLIFLSCCSLARAQVDGPSAFPEGSASIIQTRTWRIAGSDPTVSRGQARAAVEKIAEAVLVKESQGLLIVSLPTRKLAGLRQALDKRGTILATQKEAAPGAPTTLLRMTFSQRSVVP